jgi:hypothetical protein
MPKNGKTKIFYAEKCVSKIVFSCSIQMAYGNLGVGNTFLGPPKEHIPNREDNTGWGTVVYRLGHGGIQVGEW